MSEKTKARSAAVRRNPRERFVHLANRRVTVAIRHIRLIGNLANRRAYEYTDDESKKIIQALTDELAMLKLRFNGEGVSKIFSIGGK